MNLLIMGPAGSGKGTMSEKIVKKLNVAHISTGDMFRDAISKHTPVGVEAKTYMDQGLLVPDDVTNRMVKERLSMDDCLNGFLLDGFPRNLDQAHALNLITEELNRPLDYVINLDVHYEELVKRITGRRLCPTCGAIYHTETKKPEVDGICDNDGTPLIQRTDDTEEKLQVRYQEYKQQTEPVIDFYREQGLVCEVNADQPADAVWAEVLKFLEEVK